MSVKYAASLKDIAKRTDVTIATVSRAISGKGGIGKKKSEEILRVAEELGYRSNLLISGIRNGRTRTIGVMIPCGDEFYSQMFAGAHDALIEKDYCPIHIWQNAAGSNELEQIHRLIDRRVEGIVIRPVEDAADRSYFKEIYDRGVPVVTVDRELPNVDFTHIGSDDILGGELATEHLIDLGHKIIAHFQGPQYTSTAKMRRIGFERTLKRHPEISGIISQEESFTFDLEAAGNFLRSTPTATAIFAANDNIALSLLRAAEISGMKVPDDLSIIGYGDVSGEENGTIPLTTIDQHPRRIGRESVKRLYNLIESQKTKYRPSEKLLIKPDIIKRETTIRRKENG